MGDIFLMYISHVFSKKHAVMRLVRAVLACKPFVPQVAPNVGTKTGFSVKFGRAEGTMKISSWTFCMSPLHM